jgi:hypothetical protein
MSFLNSNGHHQKVTLVKIMLREYPVIMQIVVLIVIDWKVHHTQIAAGRSLDSLCVWIE